MRILYFITSAILSMVLFSNVSFLKSDTQYNSITDIKLYLPGILFGIAILLSLKPKAHLVKYFLLLLVSLIIWLISFWVGFHWAFYVTVPLAGGLGALAMIKAVEAIFHLEKQSWIKNFLLGAMVAALGIVPLLAFSNRSDGEIITCKFGICLMITFGFRLSFIIMFWQLGIGLRMLQVYGKKVQGMVGKEDRV